MATQLPPPRTTADQLDDLTEAIQKQTAWMVKRAADEDERTEKHRKAITDRLTTVAQASHVFVVCVAIVILWMTWTIVTGRLTELGK